MSKKFLGFSLVNQETGELLEGAVS